jgi:hypothetical protein
MHFSGNFFRNLAKQPWSYVFTKTSAFSWLLALNSGTQVIECSQFLNAPLTFSIWFLSREKSQNASALGILRAVCPRIKVAEWEKCKFAVWRSNGSNWVDNELTLFIEMKNEPRAACDAARETYAAHSAPTPPAHSSIRQLYVMMVLMRGDKQSFLLMCCRWFASCQVTQSFQITRKLKIFDVYKNYIFSIKTRLW